LKKYILGDGVMRKYILVLAIFGSLSELFGYGCYSSYVSGLNRYGDNFLAVRTGPKHSL